MSTRFTEVTQDVLDTLRQVREDFFPELGGAEILCIFDTKKKKSKGKIVLASISTTNDLQKFLTLEDTGTEEGYDYFLKIDKNAFKCWNS